MKGFLYRCFKRMGWINTLSACFYIIYFIVMVLTWQTLRWNELQLVLPLLALTAIYAVGWGIFHYKKKGNSNPVRELEYQRKRFIKHFLWMMPIIIIYENIRFFGQTNLQDPLMYRADQWLTGEIPSILAQHIYSNLLTEIMSFSYFIYFFTPLPFIYLYCKKKFKLIEKILFAILFSHYIALMLYIALPVEGPKYYYASDFTQNVGGCLFTDFNMWVYETVRSSTTDCFPSMHVGLFLVISYYLYRYNWRTLYFMVPVTLMMSASTLYLRYHYLIDIIAAIFLVVLTVLFTRYSSKWWKRTFINSHDV